mmetsp:Transcript_14782/g.59181  ORF Transcript_14782/g.59181 Transcript_14782/m.59181 type:complete len:225 (-) Transcript_14782:310-984(-)
MVDEARLERAVHEDALDRQLSQRARRVRVPETTPGRGLLGGVLGGVLGRRRRRRLQAIHQGDAPIIAGEKKCAREVGDGLYANRFEVAPEPAARRRHCPRRLPSHVGFDADRLQGLEPRDAGVLPRREHAPRGVGGAHVERRARPRVRAQVGVDRRQIRFRRRDAQRGRVARLVSSRGASDVRDGALRPTAVTMKVDLNLAVAAFEGVEPPLLRRREDGDRAVH